MKWSWLLALVVVIMTSRVDAQEAAPATPAAAANVGEKKPTKDEAAIREAIDSYLAAYNIGDAKALAAHFTEQGEMFSPDGNRIRGRAEIEKDFTATFADGKQSKLELYETNVELLSPMVAMETGKAIVIAPDEEPSESEYRAVHVKTAEGWKIDSVSEVVSEKPAPSHFEELQALAWLVGEWSDSDADAEVASTFRWSRNQNFLIQSFNVTSADGDVDFEGTQVIGWDPRSQSVRSWLFDSDGGFGSGKWTQGDGSWTVRTLQVLPDGRVGSATNVYERLDDGQVRYRSIGRQVEGELMPSVGPVIVARKN